MASRKWDAAAGEFDKQNPEVWGLFRKYALQALDSGRKRMGAKMIFERIRWYSTVETSTVDFKLNNNYTAYYARKFNLVHPGRMDFFATREQA